MRVDDVREVVVTERDRIAAIARVAAALAGELSLDRLLDEVVAQARVATGAGYAALGVIGRDQRLARFVHVGIDDHLADRIGPLPTGDGVLGLLIRFPRTLRLDDLSEHPASVGFPPHHPPMRAFLGTPVRSGGEVYGNLYLTDKPGGFDHEDEQLVEVLAVQVGTAVQAAVLSGALQDAAVRDERDRISRDLHDTVIQTLFSVGMSLDSTRELVTSSPLRARDRIDRAVDAIDTTIRDLRNTIFHLHADAAASLGLRDGLVELAREHEVNALVRPRFVVADDLDSVVPAILVPDVLSVVREALGNTARHAGASRVDVEVGRRDDLLTVRVTDDGVGFDADQPSAGHGLVNVRERAALHGGQATVTSTEAGTTVEVVVPLDPVDDNPPVDDDPPADDPPAGDTGIPDRSTP